MQSNLFQAVGSDAALVVIELVLVLVVVALDDLDLIATETGEPADDLIVRAPFLEVRNQVVDRDPAGGKLKPSATINKTDFLLHSNPPVRVL